MRIIRIEAAVMITGLLAVSQVAAQTNWIGPKCDLKPGHYLVNSGQLYLQDAVKTRFEDQRQKDLRDANRVLVQALTTGSQDKNPAAWYYLGRYYLMVQDMVGADTAFAHAETLKADCKNDITYWRQTMWTPMLNAGIAAWQANNPDSAMKAFRAATAINQSDPRGFKYLASLLYQAGLQDTIPARKIQLTDSAVYYFRRTADVAAKDPKYAEDRRDALYNMGRIQHSLARADQDSISKIKPDSVSPRWAPALATYREYLSLNPNDAEILASLGSIEMAVGHRDSAFAIYKQIVARADSVGAVPLFRVGVEIYQSVPSEPDTSAMGTSCRSQARTSRLTPLRAKARCDSVTKRMVNEHAAVAREGYRLASKAFAEGVRLNPYYRDGLYNLVNTYLVLNDTAGMLPAAQRLVSIDPLNRQSLRLLAFAHQQKGHVDSTLAYLRMADSTLPADVTVTQFDPDTAGVELKGLVQNLHTTPTPPMKLTFEFLNAKGTVIATETVDVPSIAPQQGSPIAVKSKGAGIEAWRYRKAS